MVEIVEGTHNILWESRTEHEHDPSGESSNSSITLIESSLRCVCREMGERSEALTALRDSDGAIRPKYSRKGWPRAESFVSATSSYVFVRIEGHYFVELGNVVSQRGTKWSSKVIDRCRSWQMQEWSPVPDRYLHDILWLTPCSGRRGHHDIAKMVEGGVKVRCCYKSISNNKQSRFLLVTVGIEY